MTLKRSPSEAVVVGTMALCVVALIWAIAPSMPVRLTLIGYLAYEAWTLVNGFQGDTLSEAIWQLAARPIVPFLFGVAFGWAVTAGLLDNPWLIAGTAFLMGHFFFQAQRETRDLVEQKAVAAVLPKETE